MPKIIANTELPKEITSAEVNRPLLAQAVRVYLANQHQGTQSAKTRSEVNRTRKKFGKQKGGGRARHGDRKAPIFVGGGIAFAPKPRDRSLKLPQEMKRLALLSALSAKAKDSSLHLIKDLSGLSGKTKEAALFLADLPKPAVKPLIVIDAPHANILRAFRNLPSVTVQTAHLLTTYDVLAADMILFMEEAIQKLPLSFEKTKPSPSPKTVKTPTPTKSAKSVKKAAPSKPKLISKKTKS